MIRVGFEFVLDDEWQGGINYFRNLLTALYDLPGRSIEAVVFTGRRAPERHFDGFPPVEIVRTSMVDTGTPAWFVRKVWHRATSRDGLLESLLGQHRIDVLSHSGWLGRNSNIPAIGWIQDFQHLHLPGNFSAAEVASRNKAFRNLCRHCAKIILSSHNARADLAGFAPECAARSEVLQFVAMPSKVPGTQLSRDELERQYAFSGRYFLLPNQFWKHKNHRVVIDALAATRSQGERILVLATGSPHDYRHPGHFDALMAYAGERGVRDSFRYLGMVPGAHLAALMKHACAIVNPSLFEGWSTTVEEAKSLGKRVLLSDIAVHREQAPELADYFAPDDPLALADLFRRLAAANPEDDPRAREKARQTTERRRLEFAQRFQEIVLDTFAGAGRAPRDRGTCR